MVCYSRNSESPSAHCFLRGMCALQWCRPQHPYTTLAALHGAVWCELWLIRGIAVSLALAKASEL